MSMLNSFPIYVSNDTLNTFLLMVIMTLENGHDTTTLISKVMLIMAHGFGKNTRHFKQWL